MYQLVRTVVPEITEDRPFYKDMAILSDLIQKGSLL
jgi:histidine ammonia-lyase